MSYKYWGSKPHIAIYQFFRHQIRYRLNDGALPDFLIAGVQKGGSTSLFRFLADHPKVVPALKKEVHYFDERFHNPSGWYKAFFAGAGPGMITGEGTPDYFYLPDTPEKISKLYGNENPIKIVLVLRNPVERAISHYKMLLRRGLEDQKHLIQAMEKDNEIVQQELKSYYETGVKSFKYARKHGYLARGEYGRILKDWLQYYSLDNMHIVDSDDLFRKPNDALKKVCDFLGLIYFPQPFENKNPGHSMSFTAEEIKHLRNYFERDSELFHELTGRKMSWF